LIARAYTTFTRALSLVERRRWYDDLVTYYGVTPDQAITDVPSEHFEFARWRLERKIPQSQARFTLTTLAVTGDALPLTESYDVIVISEVFEHLHNPLAVARHLVEHLKPGGRLWENYLVTTPSASDLKAAQEQRGAVVAHLRDACRLTAGGDPDSAPCDTRCWIRR